MGLIGNLDFGINGSDDLTTGAHSSSDFDDSPKVGYWFAIEAIGGDAVISCTMENGPSKTSITLGDGRFLYGLCSSITVVSGSVRAYRTFRKE